MQVDVDVQEIAVSRALAVARQDVLEAVEEAVVVQEADYSTYLFRSLMKAVFQSTGRQLVF